MTNGLVVQYVLNHLQTNITADQFCMIITRKPGEPVALKQYPNDVEWQYSSIVAKHEAIGLLDNIEVDEDEDHTLAVEEGVDGVTDDDFEEDMGSSDYNAGLNITVNDYGEENNISDSPLKNEDNPKSMNANEHNNSNVYINKTTLSYIASPVNTDLDIHVQSSQLTSDARKLRHQELYGLKYNPQDNISPVK